MSGYNWSEGKSSRAVNAEEDGKMTATQLAKALKCNSRAVAALLSPCEWHHTSKAFNCTNYYDEPLLLAVVGVGGPQSDWTDEEWSGAQELLSRLRAYGKAKIGGEWNDCRVDWLEWSGTIGSRSRRNRPHAEKRSKTGCRVTWSGKSMIEITFADGPTMRKKIDCNGLSITLADSAVLLPVTCYQSAEERLAELAVSRG
jgi:hypothetical protein